MILICNYKLYDTICSVRVAQKQICTNHIHKCVFKYRFRVLCELFRYGVHPGRRLFCQPGRSQSASGLLVLLPAEVSESRPQVPPAETPGLLHLLHPQPGERGGHRSVSAAEPRLQVASPYDDEEDETIGLCILLFALFQTLC